MSHKLFAATFVLFSVALIATKTADAATTSALTQTQIENKVREHFNDVPAMVEIARCESKFRQFTDSGNVLRSAGMIGIFQFYESIHAPGAKALGFDLATVDGNLSYARHLYETEGTTPWNGSRYCWDIPETTGVTKPLTNATATITTPNRAELLKQINTLTKLIAELQKKLAEKKQLAQR